ncbi:hypothetical protein Salat_0497200 [Sesamum alatum]|uniref:Uncharacterized protein n=1 Tax=Sesamum alatum TaxID=300844 RepID=A0AAE1Z517_9LAMI|nr:hypothetical protein Salat_0497200 [Sesamum alatum]
MGVVRKEHKFYRMDRARQHRGDLFSVCMNLMTAESMVPRRFCRRAVVGGQPTCARGGDALMSACECGDRVQIEMLGKGVAASSLTPWEEGTEVGQPQPPFLKGCGPPIRG